MAARLPLVMGADALPQQLQSGDSLAGAAPGGVSLTVQYNNGGVLGGMSGTAWDDTNRSLVVTGATVTTSKPLLDLAQTWNAGAVTFTAIKVNVTVTASNNSGFLMDLQRAGVTKFSVSEFGALKADTLSAIAGTFADYSGKIAVINTGQIGFSPNSTVSTSNATIDTILARDAAGILAQRNAANGQTFRTYGTYTDAANYRRVNLNMASTGLARLGVEGAGTGASGNGLTIDFAFYPQAAPAAINATATLTIAQMIGRLISTNSSIAVSLTLPTGTLADAGCAGGNLPVNYAFEWTTQNNSTAAGAITLVAAAGHTITGNAIVMINDSARWLTQKTAANTFITHRI